ncbi:MAG: hypothetical protein MCS20_02095, partial [Candidatus Phytoplasma mali]|nr:hypothetical protein [Candidatus Phytoplasma australiense]MCG7202181.1 hypothetical protein [Candidatus Phytoplasma mali]
FMEIFFISLRNWKSSLCWAIANQKAQRLTLVKYIYIYIYIYDYHLFISIKFYLKGDKMSSR